MTLGRRLRDLALGLTPRVVLEKLGAMLMLDVHRSTTDDREVILTRYTQPEPGPAPVVGKAEVETAQAPAAENHRRPSQG